jgi:hypothetical protein
MVVAAKLAARVNHEDLHLKAGQPFPFLGDSLTEPGKYHWYEKSFCFFFSDGRFNQAETNSAPSDFLLVSRAIIDVAIVS